MGRRLLEAAPALSENPITPPGADQKPRRRFFGDYELQEEIARGGMGVVYKARQLSLGRTVAVKMILGGRLAGVADVQRFRAEAEAAANLRHPNIVAIHEVGEHDGQHYFSMDYVEGRNLAELSAEGGVRKADFQKSAGWVKTLAQAIHYAHQQGIWHRDLKPSNVLIDASDQPHITDFGLAKQVKRDSDLTLSGQVLGTPNFMPPEQASGKRGSIGPHSDVYSLGALLYFLLTGKPPFAADTVHETLGMVAGAEPAAPRALNPAVPRDLQTICLKCLEKDPSRRYASAQALADDLGRFLNDEPVFARPVTPMEKLWRKCRRHRLVTGLGAAAILLPILAAILAGRFADTRNPSLPGTLDQPIAEMPTNTAAGVAGVIDGKIYVTSATDGNAESWPKSLYLYEPLKNSWRRLADYHLLHIGGAGGVVAGKLYVAGGEDLHGPTSTLEVYDPASDTWATRTPMTTRRAGCAGVVLNDKFYVLGGYDGTNYLSTVESYDWRTDAWTNEPSMLSVREGCSAAMIEGMIYAVGGNTNKAAQVAETVEAWQPGGQWAMMHPDNSMPVPVAHAGAAVISNTLYVAAGIGGRGTVSDVQSYTPGPKGGRWQPLNWMPGPRYLPAAAALNGEMYVFGGWNDLPGSAKLPSPDVFVYTPSRNMWRKSSPRAAGKR